MTLSINTMINGQIIDETAILRKELERAHVALALLKGKLGTEKITALLQNEFADGKAQWLAFSENNPAGEFTPSVTDIEAEGLSVEQFLAWFGKEAGKDETANFLSAMPEHYIVHPNADHSSQEVSETIGFWGHPLHFRITFCQPEQSLVPVEPGYDAYMCGSGEFVGGGDMKTVVTHQFRNTDKGFFVRLKIHFPANAPRELVEGHQWHLAIEFNNWIKLAKAFYDAQ